MILTHESGSQEDQFDEKKWRQKISWDYPFKLQKPFKSICATPQEKATHIIVYIQLYFKYVCTSKILNKLFISPYWCVQHIRG